MGGGYINHLQGQYFSIHAPTHYPYFLQIYIPILHLKSFPHFQLTNFFWFIGENKVFCEEETKCSTALHLKYTSVLKMQFASNMNSSQQMRIRSDIRFLHNVFFTFSKALKLQMNFSASAEILESLCGIFLFHSDHGFQSKA